MAGCAHPFWSDTTNWHFRKEAGDQFYLYRVFQFRDGPRLFTLSGDLAQHVHLKPTDYRASFREIVGEWSAGTTPTKVKIACQFPYLHIINR